MCPLEISQGLCSTRSSTRAEANDLPQRRKRHDQRRIDEPLEVGREGLGEGPVTDQEPGLEKHVQSLRGEVGGRDETLLVVVDDCLGV